MKVRLSEGQIFQTEPDHVIIPFPFPMVHQTLVTNYCVRGKAPLKCMWESKGPPLTLGVRQEGEKEDEMRGILYQRKRKNRLVSCSAHRTEIEDQFGSAWDIITHSNMWHICLTTGPANTPENERLREGQHFPTTYILAIRRHTTSVM